MPTTSPQPDLPVTIGHDPFVTEYHLQFRHRSLGKGWTTYALMRVEGEVDNDRARRAIDDAKVRFQSEHPVLSWRIVRIRVLKEIVEEAGL